MWPVPPSNCANFFYRSFRDSGLLARWLSQKSRLLCHLSASSTRETKYWSAAFSLKVIIYFPRNPIVRYDLSLFMYWTHSCIRASQEYATNKPFASVIVLESLKIAFGSMENIRNVKLYTYSHADYKKEREVPPYMVAVAATAVRYPFDHLRFSLLIFMPGLCHPSAPPLWW